MNARQHSEGAPDLAKREGDAKMRRFATISIAIALFALAGSASAQGYSAPFGSQGTMTLGAERLFGFHWTKNTWDAPPGQDDDNSGTTVGFGWAFAQHMQFNHPRAGFDYFITNNLSLGGALGFFSADGNRGALDTSGFLINPRIGYSIPITQSIAFWPRGGLEYISVGDDHAFGLSAEANFVFLLRQSWGILLSPTLDLAPFGGTEVNGENVDYGAYSFGVSVGMLGVL
jgi:hypothetical protein